jgi:hypothetical protein
VTARVELWKALMEVISRMDWPACHVAPLLIQIRLQPKMSNFSVGQWLRCVYFSFLSLLSISF